MPAKPAAKATRKAPKRTEEAEGITGRVKGSAQRLTAKERKLARELAENGTSRSDIAKALSVNPSTITRLLDKVDQEAAQTQDFVKNKADVYAHTAATLLGIMHKVAGSISDEDISEATVGQKSQLIATLGTQAAIFNDKERLERGQSTSNINSLLVVAQRGAMSTLNARLGIPECAPSDPGNTIDSKRVTDGEADASKPDN